MTTIRPEARTLEGRFVRLEPLTEEHLPGLRVALRRPEVFAGGYGGGPAGLPSEAGFDDWARGYGVMPNGIRYVVRVAGGPHSDEVVGASTLGEIDPKIGSAHLGWTGYDPRVWGTQVNPEVKLLLLGHAFDAGLGRVQLQADSRNDRSRAAILKLGATFEGVLRRHRIRADGELSGTAVYSILDGEWPGVRAGLEARLAAWGERPVHYRSV